jgi:LacI family transcriptional regulator
MSVKNKVTIAEIARRLEVSKTLVSLVLNGKGDKHHISELTQKKVWDKVKELNYKPNSVARSLRTGKTQSIGLIVADIANPFYARLARVIEDYLRPFGYHLVISSSDETAENEVNLIDTMIEHQVDGLIIASTQKDPEKFQELQSKNYPFVLIDRYLNDIQTNYIGVDNYSGACSMTKELLKSGYENVYYLSVTPDYLSTIKERERGYIDALEGKSPLIRKVGFNAPQTDLEDIINEIRNAEIPRPVLFSSNNHVAKACLKILRKYKIKIPEEIAMVSFDDIELFEFSNPPITAISQPIDKMGRLAADVLLRQLSVKTQSIAKHILKTTFVNRKSF